MLPLPSVKFPFQVADDSRIAILFSPFDQMDFNVVLSVSSVIRTILTCPFRIIQNLLPTTDCKEFCTAALDQGSSSQTKRWFHAKSEAS